MPYSTKFSSLSVGNKIIDSEHGKLSGVINGMHNLILVNHAVALSVQFKILNDCLRNYFLLEENIARAANFDFTNHKLAHQLLLHKCKSIQDKMMNKEGDWTKFERDDCIDSLNDCLIQHIRWDSAPLKKVLDTYSYDFKPN
jgi:hemerythrin-like metal-binding protein